MGGELRFVGGEVEWGVWEWGVEVQESGAVWVSYQTADVGNSCYLYSSSVQEFSSRLSSV